MKHTCSRRSTQATRKRNALARLLSPQNWQRTHRGSAAPTRRLAIESLEQRQLLAVTWDGEGGDGLWGTAANWSTDTVPGSADDVVIQGTGLTVQLLGSPPAVKTLANSATLSLEGTVALGPASLTVLEGMTNSGTLRMGTTSDDGNNQGVYVAVTGGMLTNAATGTIDVRLGQGDGRYITANVTNRGGILVEAGQTLAVNATGATFLQADGELVADGQFLQNGGRFDFAGGAVSGLVRLNACAIHVASGVTDEAELRAVRDGTLVGNEAESVTVWIEGTTDWGFARLTTQEGAVNRGTIRLETTSSDVNNQSCYLAVGEATFTNEATGLIEAWVGAGDGRSISGHLINRGRVQAEAGAGLEFKGTLDSAGGVCSGDLRILSSQLWFTAVPATPNVLNLYGASNTLRSDILGNTRVNLYGTIAYGHAGLTVPADATNYGTIRMETLSNDTGNQDVYLWVTGGALTNAATGRIEAGVGAGDRRLISGHLINQGLVQVEAGTVAEFRGTLDSAGGTCSGDLRVLSSQLWFTAVPATPNVLNLYGASNTLRSDILGNTRVNLYGTIAYGYAGLTVPADATNHGTLHMETLSDDTGNQDVYLWVTGGTLTNGATGTLDARLGKGDGRYLSGNVTNRGRISVEAGQTLTVEGTGATFLQADGELVADGQFLQNGGRFEFTGGAVSGLVRLNACGIHVASSVTDEAVLRAVGDGVLVGSESESVTVWIEGTTDWGFARLTTQEGAVNRGTIRLETTSSDGGNQSCYLAVGGATFTNEATGVIEAWVGAGDGRSISGHLINRGRVQAEAGAGLEFKGTLDSAGGVCSGDLRILSSQLWFTAVPATPNVLNLYGASNTLRSDILGNTRVNLYGTIAYGHAGLTVPADATNYGTIRMETLSDDTGNQDVYLWVTGGTLTNGATGTLDVRLGEGDGRYLSGNVTNRGRISVEAGQTLTVEGTGATFLQADGELVADGQFLQNGGRFEYTGGNVSGLVRLNACAIHVASGVTDEAELRAVGDGTLVGNEAESVTVWIEGTTDWGFARLTTQEGAVNRGTIRLETTSSDGGNQSCYLAVGGTTFTNEATGVIETWLGAGDGRSISGHLTNRGLIAVAEDTRLEVFGTFVADGGRVVGPAYFVNITLYVTASPSVPTTLHLVGLSNRLMTGNLPNTTLWVEGRVDYGPASLLLVQNADDSWTGNLLVNASFEEAGDLSTVIDPNTGLARDPTPAGPPDASDPIYVLAPNSQAIQDWQVVETSGTTVDWVHQSHLQSSDGERCVDLNGTPGPGGVQQTFATVPGQVYQVEFDLAGNAVGNLQEDPPVDPIKWLRVSAAGQYADFSFDVTGHTSTDMGWEHVRWAFLAWDTTTTLRFTSLESSVPSGQMDFGPVIDRVSVYGRSSPGVVNQGTLQLETTSDDGGDQSSNLVIHHGALINGSGGRIVVNAGAGDGRSIYGELLNLGRVDISTPAALGRPDAEHFNIGFVRIYDNPLWVTGASFTNLDGSLVSGDGSFENTGLVLNNFGTIDLNPPAVVDVAKSFDRVSVEFHLDAPLDAASAEDLAHYRLRFSDGTEALLDGYVSGIDYDADTHLAVLAFIDPVPDDLRQLVIAGAEIHDVDGESVWPSDFRVNILGPAIDPAPPTITETLPSLSAGLLLAGANSLAIAFSETVIGADRVDRYQLRALGPDALLGTADDVLVPLTVNYSGVTASLAFSDLPASVYRLTVQDWITDPVGNRLDGDGDGSAGGDWVRDFVVVLAADPISATTVLDSPHGYPFDVQLTGYMAGQLVQGWDNAFDGYSRLQVGGTDFAPQTSAALDDDGRTVVVGTQDLGGLRVHREIMVPGTGGEDFARTVDVFDNPTASPVSTTVRIMGNLGSGGATTIFATADGDTVLAPADQWIGSDDADGWDTPAIVHYLHGPLGLQPSTVIRTGDNVEWTYELTIPAGETVRLAHFTILAHSRTAAEAAAGVLVTSGGFGGQAAAFLTAQELDSVANFVFEDMPPAVRSLSPPDDAVGVPVDTGLAIIFDEAIRKGTGTIVVKQGSDGSVVETIDVGGPGVHVSGATVTILRSATLDVLTDYYVEVTAGALEDLAGNDFAGIGGATTWNFTTETLRVTSLLPTASGFEATFNGPLETAVLNLYDGAGGSRGPADVVVLDGAGQARAGSLAVDGNRRAVTWVATGGVLPTGTYTVTLRSGVGAFRDAAGHTLDGDADGTSGGDFLQAFTVAAVSQRVVSVCDIARGAGQAVNVPAAAAGWPIRIDDAAAVTSLAVDVHYDPALLHITAALPAAGLPGDWSVDNPPDTSTPGVARIRASGTTPLSETGVEVVRLTAAVPGDAPYGAVQAIRLEDISLNGGTIVAVGDVAVHKAVYLGDADGSGIHSSADAFLTVQAALGLASGFAAHPWTDPRIVGDCDGSGVLSAADAFLIVQEGLGLSEPFVPDNPDIAVTPVGGGIDPRFQIDVDIPATVGGLVSVPVKLNVEPAATNVGVVEFDLFFDPSRLAIQVPGGISAGADTAGDWVISAMRVSGGHLRVGMMSSGGQPLGAGLREIAQLQFRVEAGGHVGASLREAVPVSERPGYVAVLDIEPVDPRAGGYAWSALDGSVAIAAPGARWQDQLFGDLEADWLPLGDVLGELGDETTAGGG